MYVFQRFIWTFLVAMIPAVEVKGAIPFGIALDMPPMLAYVSALCGSFIVVCFLAFFTNWFYRYCKRKGFLKRFIGWIDKIVTKNHDKIAKFGPWGVFAYVAVPIPGTGTWTGGIIAGVLDMKPHVIILSVMCGNFVSGLILMLASTGVVNMLTKVM